MNYRIFSIAIAALVGLSSCYNEQRTMQTSSKYETDEIYYKRGEKFITEGTADAKSTEAADSVLRPSDLSSFTEEEDYYTGDVNTQPYKDDSEIYQGYSPNTAYYDDLNNWYDGSTMQFVWDPYFGWHLQYTYCISNWSVSAGYGCGNSWNMCGSYGWGNCTGYGYGSNYGYGGGMCYNNGWGWGSGYPGYNNYWYNDYGYYSNIIHGHRDDFSSESTVNSDNYGTPGYDDPRFQKLPDNEYNGDDITVRKPLLITSDDEGDVASNDNTIRVIERDLSGTVSRTSAGKPILISSDEYHDNSGSEISNPNKEESKWNYPSIGSSSSRNSSGSDSKSRGISEGSSKDPGKGSGFLNFMEDVIGSAMSGSGDGDSSGRNWSDSSSGRSSGLGSSGSGSSSRSSGSSGSSSGRSSSSSAGRK